MSLYNEFLHVPNTVEEWSKKFIETKDFIETKQVIV